MISNDPIVRPNCSRCFAYAIASRMMRRVPRRARREPEATRVQNLEREAETLAHVAKPISAGTRTFSNDGALPMP